MDVLSIKRKLLGSLLNEDRINYHSSPRMFAKPLILLLFSPICGSSGLVFFPVIT